MPLDAQSESMFRETEITVIPGEPVQFLFPQPLSITSLLVANRSEEVLWEFIAEEFRPVKFVGEDFDPAKDESDDSIPVINASFQTWRLEDAPPEMLALLELLQKREDARLQTSGPNKPPLERVAYGEPPAGYRNKQPPRPLVPGECHVLVFAEQGHASKRFVVTGV